MGGAAPHTPGTNGRRTQHSQHASVGGASSALPSPVLHHEGRQRVQRRQLLQRRLVGGAVRLGGSAAAWGHGSDAWGAGLSYRVSEGPGPRRRTAKHGA